jgi:tetratricopeptide (TPR) repeat protein
MEGKEFMSVQQTLFEQVKLCYQKNEFLKVLELSEDLLKLPEYELQCRFMQANVFHHQGKIGKALAQFKKVLELEPEHTDAMVSLAVLYNDIGQYAEAQKYFELADSKVKRGDAGIVDTLTNKKFSQLHYEIAEMYCTYQRYGEAIDDYKKAMSLDPENLKIRSQYAKAWQKIGQPDKAKEELQLLIKEHPFFLEAQISLGLLYFESNDIIQAQKIWTSILTHEPDHAEAKMYLELAKSAKEVQLDGLH